MSLHSGAAIHEPQHPYTCTSRPTISRAAFSASAKLSPRPDAFDHPHDPRIPYRRSTGNTPTQRTYNRRLSTETRTMSLTSEANSEDEQGYYKSDASETGSKSSRRRKRCSTTITTTSFVIAQPAPLTVHQKRLHIRPRLLFQLQRISPDRRPMPVIDVQASTRLNARLVKDFPRMFKGNRALKPNDVIILKSEDYNTHKDTKTLTRNDDEEGRFREALAVICESGPNEAEICLIDGTVWHAAMDGKRFEFTTTDHSGKTKTVRWISRSQTKRLSGSGWATPTSPTSASQNTDIRYSFSIIQPGQRRHPILASLTPTSLDIQDYYRSVSASSQSTPPRSLQDDPEAPRSTDGQRTHIPISDYLKHVAQLTSIWVALRLGWCANASAPRTAVSPRPRAISTGSAYLQRSATARRSTNERVVQAQSASARPAKLPDTESTVRTAKLDDSDSKAQSAVHRRLSAVRRKARNSSCCSTDGSTDRQPAELEFVKPPLAKTKEKRGWRNVFGMMKRRLV